MKLIRSKIAEEVETREGGKLIRLDEPKNIKDSLCQKLLEECLELCDEIRNIKDQEDLKDLIEEMADVREVLDAIKYFFMFSEEELLRSKDEKVNRKGDFKEFTFMINKGIKKKE